MLHLLYQALRHKEYFMRSYHKRTKNKNKVLLKSLKPKKVHGKFA